MTNVKIYTKNFCFNGILFYFNRFIKYFCKINDQELFNFFHSLSLFFQTYNDIILAFEYSIEGIQDKFAFLMIIDDLKRGVLLSTAFQRSGKFSSDILFLLRTGEKNNTLLESFILINKILKSKMNANREMKKKLFYPCLLFFVFFGVVVIFSSYVIPSLFFLLLEINSKNINDVNYLLFFVKFIKFFMFLLFLVCFLFFVLFEINHNLFFYIVIEKCHIFSEYFLNYYFYFIYYSLAISLQSGISLVDSFDLIIESLEIKSLKNKLICLKKFVQRGMTLSESLTKCDLCPKNYINIIKSGEKVGKVVDSIELCSKIFEEKYNEKFDNLMNYLPIFLVFIIAFLLILFVYLLFLPMSGLEFCYEY